MRAGLWSTEASPAKADGSELPDPALCRRAFCSPGPGTPFLHYFSQPLEEAGALGLDSQTYRSNQGLQEQRGVQACLVQSPYWRENHDPVQCNPDRHTCTDITAPWAMLSQNEAFRLAPWPPRHLNIITQLNEVTLVIREDPSLDYELLKCKNHVSMFSAPSLPRQKWSVNLSKWILGGWMDGWMDGCVDGQVDRMVVGGWMDRLGVGWTEAWMSREWINGWMNE